MDDSDIIDSSLPLSPRKISLARTPSRTIGSESDDSEDYSEFVQKCSRSNNIVIESSTDCDEEGNSDSDDLMVTADESLHKTPHKTPHSKNKRAVSLNSTYENLDSSEDEIPAFYKKVTNPLNYSDLLSSDVSGSNEAERSIEAIESTEAHVSIEAKDNIESSASIKAEVNSDSNASIEAESNIDANVSTEAEDAIDANVSIKAEVNSDSNASTEAESYIDASVSTEAEDAIDAKVSIKAEVNSDSNASTEAESYIDASVSTEAEDAIDAKVSIKAEDNIDANASIEAEGSHVVKESLKADLNRNVQDVVLISSGDDIENEVSSSFLVPKLKEEIPKLKASDESQWGAFLELPRTDSTVGGFGKKAMQTHLTQTSLTREALTQLHTALKSCPTEDTYAEDPEGLKVKLMPHQQHALAWLMWRETEVPAGGILADDMGLGKTLTMISLILKKLEDEDESSDESDSDEDVYKGWHKKRPSKSPLGGTLIVCPASLVSQWESEIKKRCHRRVLSVLLYHGPQRETRTRKLTKYDVVITTYNLMGRESGVETPKNCTTLREEGPLHRIRWNRIILDEAHVVRNHKSLSALGVCALEGRYRWCLTGTPIQNRELDLYALMKFLKCSPFDDLAVWKRWVDNKNAAGMQRLNTMMKSLMLRRTKEQLLENGQLKDLPARCCEIKDVHLDQEELEVYEKVALFSKTLFAQFLSQRAEKQQHLDAKYGFSNRPTWQQGERPDNQFCTTEELAQMHIKMQGLPEVKASEILVVLLRLRQICCHPGLAKKMIEKEDFGLAMRDETNVGITDDTGLDIDLFDQMNKLAIGENSVDEPHQEKLCEEKEKRAQVLSVDNPIFNFERPSAKIRAIIEVLDEKILNTEDKVVIVSQWVSMLRILWDHLKEKKVRCEMLSGDVPVHKRQAIVTDFNRPFGGAQILLLSLTAGGVGLNLVGGNHLMLIDNHWNPQLETQACDRIYRVGQRKPVHIYKFITINTIEERIKALQEYKLSLADGVLTGSKNAQASKLSLDDLMTLFNTN